MKTSIYNITVDKKEDGILVFNSLNGSIAILNKHLYQILNTKPLQVDDGTILKTLQNLGFIVEDDFDELKAYHDMHLAWKTGKEVVNFNVLLTYDCNFACPYCYQGRGEEGGKIHNFAQMAKNIYVSKIFRI